MHLKQVYEHWQHKNLLPGPGGLGRQNPRLMDLLYALALVDNEIEQGRRPAPKPPH